MAIESIANQEAAPSTGGWRTALDIVDYVLLELEQAQALLCAVAEAREELASELRYPALIGISQRLGEVGETVHENIAMLIGKEVANG